MDANYAGSRKAVNKLSELLLEQMEYISTQVE